MPKPTFAAYPFDLHAPGAVDELLEFHRATFGGFRMADDPADKAAADKAAADKATADKAAADKATADGGGGGDGKKDTPVKLDITQADLDRILGDRLAAEKKKHEKELEDLKATAGKTELEKAQLEKKNAEDRLSASAKSTAERIAKTEAKLAAITAGANPDRINAIVGQADLTAAVDEDGNVDEAKVKAAVEKVLTDYPEWKATTMGTKSGSELGAGGGGDGDKPSYTRKQIEDMTDAERVANIDKINEAMAAGRITG